jgi:hypothetical protein
VQRGKQMDISEILEQPYFLPYKKLFRVFICWEEIIGKELGSKSEPIGIKDSVLSILADDEFVMTEMHFIKEEIKEAVNKALGEPIVEEVRIICHKRKEKKRKSEKIIDEEFKLPAEIERIINSCKDEELRKKLRRFASAVLMRAMK